MVPRYLRNLVWDRFDKPSIRSTASVSVTHSPLPDVPLHTRNDPVMNDTLRIHSLLFKIVSGINVDRFQYLLQDHPNQPFVLSVCRPLREGFWPWAVSDDKPAGYPLTWDAAKPSPRYRKPNANLGALSSLMLICWLCNPDGPTLVGSHAVDRRDVAKMVVASLTALPTPQVGRKQIIVNVDWFNGRNAVDIIARHRPELKPHLSRQALAEEPHGEHYVADRSRAREVLRLTEYTMGGDCVGFSRQRSEAAGRTECQRVDSHPR
ncbi:unnamed protein product [Somion occarium]|uniref:Uncharacterized protein n=1 Tax=Somion occarium TaxID=3059160 RepID=A0ABP1DH39_9APHY